MGMRLAHRQIFGRRLAVQRSAAGGEDHTFGLGLTRSFENMQGADDVHLGVERRSGHRDSDVGLGRQVKDQLGTAPDHQIDDGRRGDVEVVNGQRPPCTPPRIGQVGERAGREVIDDIDLMSFDEQSIDQGRADETSSSRHHRAHPRFLAFTRSPSTSVPDATTAPAPNTEIGRTSARWPTMARGPSIEPATLAFAATWLPSISTESMTTAPASITEPAPSTERSTRAPAATVHPAKMTEGPTTRPSIVLSPSTKTPLPRSPRPRHRHALALPRYQVAVGLQEGRGRSRIKPVPVIGPGEEDTAAHHGRKRLSFDRDTSAGGDPIQYRWFEYVGARIDLVRGRIVAWRLFDERGDPSLAVGRHDSEGRRVRHGMERNGPLGPALSMEGDERTEIEVGEDVAVDDDEGLVDAAVGGGETHRTRRVEWLGLDGIREPDPRGVAVRIGLLEGVGQIAQGENRLLHPVRRQVGQHPLDHRHPDDRQHLLGCRQGEGAEPGPLATYEDNCLH